MPGWELTPLTSSLLSRAAPALGPGAWVPVGAPLSAGTAPTSSQQVLRGSRFASQMPLWLCSALRVLSLGRAKAPLKPFPVPFPPQQVRGLTLAVPTLQEDLVNASLWNYMLSQRLSWASLYDLQKHLWGTTFPTTDLKRARPAFLSVFQT